MLTIQEAKQLRNELLSEKLYFRMRDLATTVERKPRTYTTKSGVTRKIKGRPARQGLLPMGESTIWDNVRNGSFPKPIKLSERVTAWRAEDIEAWLASKSLGA